MRPLSSAFKNNNQRTAELTMKFGTEYFY